MNRNAVLQKIFEPERRSGAFRLNSTTANISIQRKGYKGTFRPETLLAVADNTDHQTQYLQAAESRYA
jgi:hypothetical protein